MATKLIPVGTEYQVNIFTGATGVGGFQLAPEIAPLSGGGFIVVYQSNYQTSLGDWDVYGQRLAANGSLVGNRIDVRNFADDQTTPDVTQTIASVTPDGFAAVWVDSVGASIALQVFDASNSGLTPILTVANPAQPLSNPAIATFGNGTYLVAYEQYNGGADYDVEYAIVNATGATVLSGPTPVSTAATTQDEPQVAARGARGLIVWSDAGTSATRDIELRVIDSGGGVTSSNQIVADHSNALFRPDVTPIADDRYVIVYDDSFDVFGRIYDPSTPGGAFLGPEFQIDQPGGFGEAAQIFGTIDGGFIATWEVFTSATGYDIHARRFDAHGVPFGDEFVVNTLTDNFQLLPAVSTNGSNVVLTWQDSGARPGDMDPTGIRGQAFTTTALDYDSAPHGDFNNNGRSDILFQNENPAAPVALWETNTSGALASIISLGALPAGYLIVGTGNFNSTPGDDILIRKGTEIDILVPNGTNPPTFVDLGGNVPNGTLNAGMGDFTGDGQDDLLFQTGNNIASWRIVNNQITQIQTLGSTSPDYHIVGIDDFTGDHQADILFRRDNGEIARWQIANNQLVPGGAQTIGTTSPLYHVVGTGDFDGNGATDILFRNDNGDLALWLLNSSGQLLGAPAAIGNAGLQYHVDGTGDLNGDGRSDIIFRDANGTLVEWLMNGTSFAAPPSVLGTAAVDYSIAAHHFDLI
jgi:hypothetical protein